MGAEQDMTIEDLSSVYRVERKSKALSHVRKDLYHAIARLLINIRIEYEKQLAIDPDSIMCEGINQRRKNANRLSKEIVETRMEKVCLLAVMGARGGQNVLDGMTPEEREYYGDILSISKRQDGILDRLSGKKRFETPDIASEAPMAHKAPIPPAPAAVEPARAAEAAYEVSNAEDELADSDAYIPDDPEGDVDKFFEPQDSPAPIAAAAPPSDADAAVIRVLESLPPFSGPDRDYNLSKEDVVRMPAMMADALIARGKAVLVSPSP
ncbi:MAG: hypothetical protein LBT41_02950 [Candidatus Methanoplasma sp.]|jgi:DNA replication factor GINS|nr:hypothetical protein [Candidatus Methanoplasma sp.]